MPMIEFRVAERTPYAQGRSFGPSGSYSQLDGTAHFAVDPAHAANIDIVDLQHLPTQADGLVHFDADLSVVLPDDARNSNGRALVELPNRGRRRLVVNMNQAPPTAPVTRQADPGDGFLFERGYTVASIGWQWDVYRTDAMMGLEAPSAVENDMPISGETVVEFRPSAAVTTCLLADRVHQPLPASPGPQPDAVLYVRDYEDGEDTIIDRSSWEFADGSSGTPRTQPGTHLSGARICSRQDLSAGLHH